MTAIVVGVNCPECGNEQCLQERCDEIAETNYLEVNCLPFDDVRHIYPEEAESIDDLSWRIRVEKEDALDAVGSVSRGERYCEVGDDVFRVEWEDDSLVGTWPSLVETQENTLLDYAGESA